MFNRNRLLLNRNRTIYLTVRATPNECTQMLQRASRPSTHRLQDRNLFSQGRRYTLEAESHHFRMLTTSKQTWHHRRTRPSALLYAEYTRLAPDITRVALRTRIRSTRLLEALLIPTFMASILVSISWPIPLIAVCIVSIYAVSILLTIYTAKIEANEMIYFVEKVLEEFEPVDVMALAADIPYVQDDSASPREFAKEWEKFYRRYQG